MHDPMVVAFDLHLPIPRRRKWRDPKPGQPRWSWRRRVFSDPEGHGSAVYSWWRPAGYEPVAFGRAWQLVDFGYIWHVEPDGQDSGTVCKRWQVEADGVTARRDGEGRALPSSAWKWHVWHWHLQVFFLQKLRRTLLDRCAGCGRWFSWGYAPVSNGWDTGAGRKFWQGDRTHSFHFPCADVQRYAELVKMDKAIVKALVAELRVHTDEGSEEVVERLYQASPLEFVARYRLKGFFVEEPV